MKQGNGIIKSDAIYYGCDGLDGIDAVEGFDISSITQGVSYLSHFNSNTTEGAAKTYIDAYKAKYGNDAPLNQFGAAAYDCVYAIYEAMKFAVANGSKIEANISASDLCEILKAQFNGGYTLAEGTTGKNIKWQSNGFVDKTAVAFVIKEANA